MRYGSWRRPNVMVRINMLRAVSGFARLLFFLGLLLVSGYAVARPTAPAKTLHEDRKRTASDWSPGGASLPVGFVRSKVAPCKYRS